MSEIKVNKITPKQNCTQVTLGDSGDTFVIPSGVTITNNGTQTGFGRTGTVNWDTTAKTASFTAVSGNGYFVNTTSGAVTMTLPATPSAGDIVAVADYANTFATNNLTVDRNGSNIGGVANNATLSTNGVSVTFVYVDSTQGWIVTDSGSRSDLPAPAYVAATGGTITCCGDYKIHTFTGPGTFCVSCAGNACGSTTVDYLVVAGGGGGGSGCAAGGAGGAGGMRFSFPNPATGGLSVSAQAYPITVGAGGTKGDGSVAPGCLPTRSGSKGSDSIFSSITSTGGGLGGAGTASNKNGGPGGSGGAGGRGASAGSGNTPPVSPPQGNNAGSSSPGPLGNYGAGGGGGHGAVGGNASGNNGGNGGAGSALSITGASVTYAGGGGGGTFPISCGQPNGGAGGGGRGAPPSLPLADMDGTANTGGGGGGGSENPVYGPIVGAPNDSPGGAGGSGIVIIRYKYQ